MRTKTQSVQDEVFQVSELVEPYRVASSIELEQNSNFHVFDDSLVDVDVDELNVVLSSSGQAHVDEDDENTHIEVSMELMTIQMTKKKKKKIQTNYQNMKV